MKLPTELSSFIGRERDLDAIEAWLSANAIQTLNVAGPRESQKPGVYAQAYAILVALLSKRSE